MKTTRAACPKCHGLGCIEMFRGIDNGKCHLCAGAGFVLVDEETVAAALPARAEIIARVARALDMARAQDCETGALVAVTAAVALAPADVQARALSALDRLDSTGSASRYVAAGLEAERARYLSGRRVRAVRSAA